MDISTLRIRYHYNINTNSIDTNNIDINNSNINNIDTNSIDRYICDIYHGSRYICDIYSGDPKSVTYCAYSLTFMILGLGSQSAIRRIMQHYMCTLHYNAT